MKGREGMNKREEITAALDAAYMCGRNRFDKTGWAPKRKYLADRLMAALSPAEPDVKTASPDGTAPGREETSLLDEILSGMHCPNVKDIPLFLAEIQRLRARLERHEGRCHAALAEVMDVPGIVDAMPVSVYDSACAALNGNLHDCNTCSHVSDQGLCTIAKGVECRSSRRYDPVFPDKPPTDFYEGVSASRKDAGHA